MTVVHKRILITGGCGFVGRHLIAALSREPDSELWVIDNLSTGKHPDTWEVPNVRAMGPVTAGIDDFEIVETKTRVRFIFADFVAVAQGELGLTPPLGLARLPHFDEVYHLASVVGGRNVIDNDPLAVGIDLAIDSTFYLWAAKLARPDRILYASSSAAYPTDLQLAGQGIPLKEEYIDFGARLGLPDYTYGWSKLTGEYLGRIAVEKYGLRIGVVRPFSGYGEDQEIVYPFPAIALRAAARQNPIRVWGSGYQGRDFVHIDDACEACIKVCREVDDASAYNIGWGQLVNFRMSDKPVGVGERFCDPTRMTERLGWTPRITLDDGIRRALAFASARLERGIEPE
jgi:nucleoside-diphosphate-sugar epimerase